VLLINTASAQSIESTTATFNRLYVGVSTTQGVGYRYLLRNKSVPAPDNDESIPKDVIQIRNKQDKPDYAFDAGIRLGVNVTHFFSIETGIDYYRTGYFYKQDSLVSSYHSTPSGIEPDEIGNLKMHNYYNYINVPLALNFTIGEGKLKALISTGANFNVFLGTSYHSIINFEGKHSNNRGWGKLYAEPITTFNISPFLGIGINYQITPLIALRAMPTFQMQTLKNVKDAPLTEYLYSGGINVALTFGFIDVNTKGNK